MRAKLGLGESVGHRGSGSDRLLRALWHGAGVTTATPITDGDLGKGEDLIVVWRDDELLNAIGRISQDVDSAQVPFDMSSDRQLVELLLAWRVGSAPFRDAARAMIWTSDRWRFAEDIHRDRADGERVGSCAAWAGGESPRTIPRRLLLPGHLEIERKSQRRACSTNSRRNGQIVKLTRYRGLGR
ncbi:MAG: hypothetical protein WAN20_02245 [Pseudonocardiaceae bacterium]